MKLLFEIHVYRTADLPINPHGDGAPVFAAMQADKVRGTGDFDGSTVRKQVLKASYELLDKNSPGVDLALRRIGGEPHRTAPNPICGKVAATEGII